MHCSEKMIRIDIENITKYRTAPTVENIRRDIKYALWHGFIEEYIYIELLELVRNKYNSLFE